ncbi:MAG: RDD family protein [Proteobacteria bacterium]|nr:RDD family protein [Pseudomonadota bacterium]
MTQSVGANRADLDTAELDTVIYVETPEGVLLELRPAGLPVRLYAFMLDAMFRAAILYALVLVLSVLGGLGVATMLIAAFLLEWFYPVLFELTRSGATPGKKVFGLTVLMDNGLPVTPGASITRNLLRTADFLPFAYAAGVVCMLVRCDFKRLGDLAAATMVVYRPVAPPPATLAEVAPQPPAMALSPRAQAAVIAFAARLPRLTAERAAELARLATPATGRDSSAEGLVSDTDRLVSVAHWLLGRR